MTSPFPLGTDYSQMYDIHLGLTNSNKTGNKMAKESNFSKFELDGNWILSPAKLYFPDFLILWCNRMGLKFSFDNILMGS